MNLLSVVVITLNEEKDLPRCLESVKNIAGEIIVVDSGSSDKTVEIAKRFGAKVYTRKFDNYASQKNFAASKSTCQWILSLDADEVVSSKLSDEINLVLKNPIHDGYSLPRKNIIFGKWIRHTRWDAELDRHVWLWKRDKGTWKGDVHEEVVVSGKVGKLKNAKVHYQYETVTEFFTMLNNYSELDAKARVNSGRKFSFLKMLFDSCYNFCVRYFYRLGFLDGWRGFFLSYLMAIYHLILWVKVWELRKAKITYI